jgi:hypothetical protein
MSETTVDLAKKWLETHIDLIPIEGSEFREVRASDAHVAEVMIQFAQAHLEAFRKEVIENINMEVKVEAGYLGDRIDYEASINYHNNCGGSRYYEECTATVNKQSILSAYPLENIK